MPIAAMYRLISQADAIMGTVTGRSPVGYAIRKSIAEGIRMFSFLFVGSMLVFALEVCVDCEEKIVPDYAPEYLKWGFADAIWFAITRGVTLGFSDFAPRTSFGRLVTMGMIFWAGSGLMFGIKKNAAQYVWTCFGECQHPTFLYRRLAYRINNMQDLSTTAQVRRSCTTRTIHMIQYTIEHQSNNLHDRSRNYPFPPTT